MTNLESGARGVVRRQYLDGRFGQLHLRIAKPATALRPPLLCFHMSPHSGRIYQRFMAAMATDRIVVAPDTPGFGESDPPPRRPTIEDYAAAMGDLIDALGFHAVDVMGYHTGSETCTALALQRPRQVRRAVLVSAPIFTAEELVEFRAHYGPTQLTADGSHLAKKWQGHVRWSAPGRTLEMVAEGFADAVRNPSISWWGHAAAFDYDMGGQLQKVAQPVLVLDPDDDLHEHTQRARGILRQGRIQHLPGWGHGMLDLHTDELREIVAQFLDAP
ncbi:MAG: alpha/beta fold hydrolase [Steroidobacteraceae bacterium]